MYLITEKLTSTLVLYMILKRVMRPWNKWKAFEHGIIDDKGKRLKRPKSSEEREGWDILDRFCWSIKRLCTKYLGDSQFAYLFSLAYLMKEKCSYPVTQNFDKYKQELEDFNTTKQKLIFDCIQEMGRNNLLSESNLDLETNALKIHYKAERLIKKYLIEDEVMGATTTGDVAQFTPVIGNTKIQRRLKYRRRKRNGRSN